MTTKEELLALIEELPERGLQEALEEVRSIHGYWTGSSLISVELQSSAARLERIKGRLLGTTIRPPLVLED